MQSKFNRPASYNLPLPPVLVIGIMLACGFLVLIRLGPLDFEILRRYCLGHAVAVASVFLFSIALVGLCFKLATAWRQLSITGHAATVLNRLLAEARTRPVEQRISWLLANWETQPGTSRFSWLGERIEQVLKLQVQRSDSDNLDNDLQIIADRDSDRQHESYSLLRIIHWAMPMLGFLGTVLGISQTLGRLDTQLLATQQQEAMNQLTAGLYVAFDTTAIALVLTVASMFMQFAVNRLELNLLSRIDEETNHALIGLGSARAATPESQLLEPMRELANEMIEFVRNSSAQQAEVWRTTMESCSHHWVEATQKIANHVDQELSTGVREVLQEHLLDMQALQADGENWAKRQAIEWDQKLDAHCERVNAGTQQLVDHAELLQATISGLDRLTEIQQQLDARVADSGLARLENASQCIGEAVALLGTTMERAGLFRRVPTRRRTDAQDKTTGKAA